MEPARLGDAFKGETMATLAEFVDLIGAHPQVKAMIELKQESIDAFNLDVFTELVFKEADRLRSQLVIISFNADVIERALKAGFEAGWVVEPMDENNRQTALALKPQYMITDVDLIDVQAPDLWQAPEGHQWQWMLYDVLDPELTRHLMDQGVDLIETADVRSLIEHFDAAPLSA